MLRGTGGKEFGAEGKGREGDWGEGGGVTHRVQGPGAEESDASREGAWREHLNTAAEWKGWRTILDISIYVCRVMHTCNSRVQFGNTVFSET